MPEPVRTAKFNAFSHWIEPDRIMPQGCNAICVYCASSTRTDRVYLDAARRLGEVLAEEGITTVYGGGGVGSMGALADGALSRQGRVIGVLPRFLYDLEAAHPRLSELKVVEDLHERKRLMIQGADAIVSLPGGSGTLEELFEAITWKRLGLHSHPIVLVNVRGFYDHVGRVLDHAIAERFMEEAHRDMWTVVSGPEAVLNAVRSSSG